MFYSLTPWIMAIVGALAFGLASNPKIVRIGELCLLAGFIGIACGFWRVAAVSGPLAH